LNKNGIEPNPVSQPTGRDPETGHGRLERVAEFFLRKYKTTYSMV